MKDKIKLPEGWRLERLSNIGRIITGNTPSRSEDQYYGGNIPWIKPEDLDKDVFVSKSAEYLTEKGVQKARPLPQGTILVSCIGNVGKMAIADTTLATNQQINSLILDNNYNGKYVFYSLKNSMQFYVGKANQALVPIINATDFGKITIPLPPNFEEQTRIANEVEFKIAEVEKIRQAAVRQKEAVTAMQGAILREAFPYKEGDKLPEGWKWERIGNLGDLSQGGTPSTHNLDYWNGKIPFITGADVTELYISKARSFLTEKGLNSGKTQQCEKGDLLIVSRTRVGRIGIAATTIGISQDMSVLKAHNGYDVKYLAMYLKSISQRLVESCQGAIIKGLTRNYIENIPVLLPPMIDDQMAIANQLERKMVEVEKLRKAGDSQSEAVGALPGAVLREVFEFEEQRNG